MNRAVRLWERAPLWRASVLGAGICTALVVLFPPTGPTSSGYTAATPGVPPIPTGLGSSYQPPVSTTVPTTIYPVAPVAPAPPSIAPSRSIDPAALPPAQSARTAAEFGVYRGKDDTKIRPSGQIVPSGPKLAPSQDQEKRD